MPGHTLQHSKRHWLVASMLCLAWALPSHAVNVATDGIGEVTIAPYYTVRNGWKTLLNVTNTRNVPVVVKVRFREALNGRDVLNFTLTLSAFDAFAGVLLEQPDGTPVFRAADAANSNGLRSCTVPSSIGQGVPTPLSNIAYTASEPLLPDVLEGDPLDLLLEAIPLDLPRNDDGGPQGIDRAKEGWVEIISMGYGRPIDPTIELPVDYDPTDADIDPFNPAVNPIDLALAIERHACDQVETAFGSGTRPLLNGERADPLAPSGRITRTLEAARQFGEPINSLRTSLRLQNSSEGVEMGIPSLSLANFYNPAAEPSQLADDPTTADLDLLSADGIAVADIDLGAVYGLDTLQLNEVVSLLIPGLPVGEAVEALLVALSQPENRPYTPRGNCTGTTNPGFSPADACVRPAGFRATPTSPAILGDNLFCDIPRDAPRRNAYVDWRPDGHTPPLGLLRALFASPAGGTLAPLPGILEAALDAAGGAGLDLLGPNYRTLSTCRNLITAQVGARALEPSLNDAYPARATFYSDSRDSFYELVPEASTITGYNLPEDKRGVDAVSLILSKTALINEWADRNATGTNSSWIINHPTKPFYTDGQNRFLGLGLITAGRYSAVGPRGDGAVIYAPLTGAVLTTTSRPESLLQGTLTLDVLDGGGAIPAPAPGAVARVGLSAGDVPPYAPFQEAFGQQPSDISNLGDLIFPLLGSDLNAVLDALGLTNALAILGIVDDEENRATAMACNDVGFAIRDRAEQSVFDNVTGSSPTVYDQFRIELLGQALVLLPQDQFPTRLCLGSNNLPFGDNVFGASAPQAITSDVQAAIDNAGFSAGWMALDLGWFGEDRTIDVASVATIPEIDFLEAGGVALARLLGDPDKGASISGRIYDRAATLGDPANSNLASLPRFVIRGLPSLGMMAKRRTFGATDRNFASATVHSSQSTDFIVAP